MLFNKRINKMEDELNENFKAAHNHTSFVEKHLHGLADAHNQLCDDFEELKKEIETNGVVRDLRKLEKRLNSLENGIQGMLGAVESRFNDLNSNGVAGAINKLNAEVFGTRKSPETSLLEKLMRYESGDDEQEVATLAGKVDAIIAHLGVDVTVQPEETKPAEVVAKKKPAQKKRRRQCTPARI